MSLSYIRLLVAIIASLATMASTFASEAGPNQQMVPELVRTIDGFGTGEIALSHDGKWLGLSTMNSGCLVLDPVDGEVLLSVEWPSGNCCGSCGMACAFNARATMFAASRSRDVVVLRLDTKEVLFSGTMPDSVGYCIGALAFAADDGSILFGGQMRGMWELDLADWSHKQVWRTESSIESIDATHSTEMFAIGQFSGEVAIWDRRSQSAVHVLSSCSSYGSTSRVCGDLIASGCGASAIDIWSTTEWKTPRRSIERPYIAQSFSVAGVAGTLFTGTSDGAARDKGTTNGKKAHLLVYDLETGSLLAEWSAHDQDGIRHTAIAEDGSLLASWGYDREINVWRSRAD